MRLPRDLSGEDIVRRLEKHGYRVVRRRSNHIRLVQPGPPEHHVTVPAHPSVKVGTLSAILAAVAEHLHVTKDHVLED